MNLGKTVLALGIAIVFAVFIGYGLYVVYPPQDFNYEKCYDTCDRPVNPKTDCLLDKPYEELSPREKDIHDLCIEEQRIALQECEESRSSCYEEIDKEREPIAYKYARNSFFILILFSILAILFGLYHTSLEGISSGFIGGGILLVLWSLMYTHEYWVNFSKYVKLVALGLILLLLVCVGYKKLDNPKKSKRKK